MEPKLCVILASTDRECLLAVIKSSEERRGKQSMWSSCSDSDHPDPTAVDSCGSTVETLDTTKYNIVLYKKEKRKSKRLKQQIKGAGKGG
ncbi:hypothetical protein EGR_06301 [Echinococcus granulosus]|uniref:Uncharacterized protein n=1 Tax=Echinococcus granulosus TaxID=6210 RepID=W6UL95_ECHGR|nr:hypothetical protein EGR_06301 [Echinococcus granulosus]EUB58877.1 hypothetical protein EGR_06301 [Echinococcus granulosus]